MAIWCCPSSCNRATCRRHLQEKHLPRLALVDLDVPATATLDALVGQILKACGNHVSVPCGAATVAALNGLKASADVTFLAFCHFENVQARWKAYGVELFFALRHLVMDERKLVLLVESRVPFRELLPKDHPLSNGTGRGCRGP